MWRSAAVSHGHPSGGVNALGWSGGVLASGAWDGSVRLWGRDGAPLACLTDHRGAVNVLGWSPVEFGLSSVVMPVTAAVGSIVGQSLATRGRIRPVALVGMALTGLGCAVLTQVSVDGGYLSDIFLGLLIFGPGLGAGPSYSEAASAAGAVTNASAATPTPSNLPHIAAECTGPDLFRGSRV